MPMYEYTCPTCKVEVEHLQKFDDPAPVCSTPTCAEQGVVMKRKVSRTSFELRGGGWAKDGYSG